MINGFKDTELVDKFYIIGKEDSGKNTFIQYAINNLLPQEKVKEIYVLDFDPGQPMFTLPGCMSLVKVTMPILTNNIPYPCNGVEIIS